MSVLITGTAKGLGAALSKQAKKRGHSVAGIDYKWDNNENCLLYTSPSPRDRG